MKYITPPKSDICEQLNGKETPKNSTEATNRWSTFSKHKEELLQKLLENQYQLCCYSELRADEQDYGYHIEHIENKSQNPARTFDHTNLAASALNSDPDLKKFKEKWNEPFGGHALGKSTKQAIDMTQFITCYQLDCQRFFSYLSNGEVTPAENLSETERGQADYTIKLLNLNSGYLTVLRKEWWKELDDICEEYVKENWDLKDLAGIYLLPTTTKQTLSQFFSLTYQFFSPISEHII